MEVPRERVAVARAYVYAGDWVADCPRPGGVCGNVEFLHRPSRIGGPRDVPVDFFLDHPVAVRFGLPHGQSVRDLEAESEEHGVLP
jgi:hypothetical protein